MRSQDERMQALIQTIKENNEMHEQAKRDAEDTKKVRSYMEGLGIQVF